MDVVRELADRIIVLTNGSLGDPTARRGDALAGGSKRPTWA